MFFVFPLQLLMGIIDKETVSKTMGSLIHVIWHEAGPEATKMFSM